MISDRAATYTKRWRDWTNRDARSYEADGGSGHQEFFDNVSPAMENENLLPVVVDGGCSARRNCLHIADCRMEIVLERTLTLQWQGAHGRTLVRMPPAGRRAWRRRAVGELLTLRRHEQPHDEYCRRSRAVTGDLQHR